MISLLNVARPIAMKALQNPKILGSLLVGSVGAQQANEIQNQLSLGNISLDDVYDTLINFASSPAVSIINEMQTTPSGEVYAPDQEQIDAERKFNEELNKKITTASETPKADILITPDVQETFEPLITLPPEFKLDQEGFTPAPEVKPSDYIMKSEEKKTDLKPNEKIFNQIAGVKNHTVERNPNDLFLEGWEKMIFPSPKQIGSIGNYAVAIDPMKRSDNNFLLVKDGKVHATLELATAMGQDKVLELDAIGVPAEMQGQGVAKDVLNELFKLADANEVTIQGVAQPFGNKALNKKQLISFYKNMGFEVRGDEITRKPVIAKEESSLVPPIDFNVIPENTSISVKPVPKKVAVDKGLSENEGVYMANVDGQNVDLKNKTFNTANISVTPDGIPKFDVQNAINRDIEKVPGSKLTKVNLFKKSAGWKWLDKPEGGNDSFLVSVEQGGKHYYTLDTNMTADTQLKYYPNEKSEPRLRPTAYDDLVLGNKVGEIDVRGKKHPVYDSIEVSSPKQAVGADVTPKIEMINVPEKSQKDFFETSYEYDTYNGRIEDMEYRYHGGVGDLGDNQAAKSIQKIDGYDDYAMYLQEQAENFLGSEFKGFRITNTKEVMQLLNKQNKNKIKSFTLNPKQAIKFGYFANEAFMDPITTQPRGDLLVIESPIKSTSLVMRGRPEEAEVVSNTTRTSIKQSRIYNPYTGEVVYEPTEGPLVGTQPHQFETLIRTKSDIAPFISDLQSKYTKPDVTPKTVYSPQDSVLKDEIRPVLTKDLLKPQYLKKLKDDDDISCGQCYAASEAAFHMYGKDNGFKSYVLNSKTFPEGLDEGETHWFLKNKEGEIIDPTAEQFGGITIPYDKGKGTGFLTKNPSNAAQQIIDRINKSDVVEKTISPKEYTPKMKTDIPYDYVEAVNPTKVFGEQDLRKEKYLNKTADPINYSFTSNDLDQIKSKVFKEYKNKTGVDIEQIANNFGFKMPDLDLLNNSLNRDEKARYWWQQSAEWLDGLMDQLDLTKDEKNLFLEVVSTTSGGVDPAQNLKIALGVFSDMLSNRPIRMGFKTAQSLDVLLKDKESKINSPKFRNYVDSFKYFAGTDDRIPNTTIDLQMSKIFGMNPEALAGNPDLYSLVTMVVNDLTNEVNKSIPKGEELLQPFELQAMMWTENRGGRSTNFSEVGPQVLMQMENLGYSINREDIKDINFVRDLQSTVRPFEESIKMTVESGTFSTPQGNKIEQIINSFPDDKVLMDKINQVNKSTNLSLISKSKKNPSIIEDLVSAVVGEKAEMSRLIQGFGTSEGQVGNNIIVPSVYKNNKGQMIQLSDQQRLFILSTLGKYLDQNSVSSSNFILVDDSLQIPQGTKPTTSYYVPSTKYKSLVNDGLVDINTIIGKINYGN
jgi:GNAT superfamily N-acetyltransferase